MNSLFEVVLWGAPVVLLICAFLLALACGLAFRDERSPREKLFWRGEFEPPGPATRVLRS
jgi:cytochrome c-type biogenesis protein CcmH/NrfF